MNSIAAHTNYAKGVLGGEIAAQRQRDTEAKKDTPFNDLDEAIGVLVAEVCGLEQVSADLVGAAPANAQNGAQIHGGGLINGLRDKAATIREAASRIEVVKSSLRRAV
jgi:hypothetical protein